MGKYSRAYQRDFEFYSANVGRFAFCGRSVPVPDRGSMTVKKAFLVYDSQGKLMPCVDPASLAALIACKASVNFHIKLWAQGVKQGVLGGPELREILHEISAPEWVYRAIVGQALKC